MEIAFVGLGRMGAGMTERLLSAGHRVHGYDQAHAAVSAFAERGGRPLASLAAIGALQAPRAVWLMVPAGDAVDATVRGLMDVLAPGDVVVDGGNSHYRDTRRRGTELAARGIAFVDVGTSGGIWGQRDGYCLMVGGDERAIEHLRPALAALAPAPDRGWGRVGGPGAGHFAKMVHNGIEYGVMQSFAEGFALLAKQQDPRLDPAQVAEIWRHGSVIRSWLLDLVAGALAEEPDLASVAPWVPDSGAGRWAVLEALELDVPAPVLTLALLERLASREKDSFAHRLLATMRARFGGHAVRRKEG